MQVGDEPGRREAVAVAVSARELSADHVDLADGTLGHRTQAAVEDPEAERVQRTADEARTLVAHQIGIERTVGHVDRRLGDAVHVDEFDLVTERLVPVVHLVEAQLLATEDDVAQRQRRSRPAPDIGHDAERRGRQGRHGDLLVGEQLQELGGRAGDHPVHDHRTTAGEQRAEDLPHGEVEGIGVEDRPHVLGRELEVGGRRVEQRGDVPMHDLDTLGRPRRSGGVDDVGRRLRGPRAARYRDRGDFRSPRLVEEMSGLDDLALPRPPGPIAVGDDQARRGGVVDDVAQTLFRIAGVEWQVSRSRLQNGQHHDDETRVARRRDADQVACSDTASVQRSRHRVRAAREFGVAERRAVGVGDRAAVTMGGRDLVEHLDDGRRGRPRLRLWKRVEQPAIGVHEQADVGDGGVECLLRQEPVQERQESLVQCVEFGRCVQMRVAVQVHDERCAGARLVQVDQQVLEDARGQDPVLHLGAVDGDLLVEEHHVDGGPEGDRTLVETGVAADVVGAVALVSQRAGQFELRGLDQLADRSRRHLAQPDRQDVGHHAAGDLDLGGGAAGDRETQDDVVVIAHPGEERTERGCHQDRERAVELAGECLVAALPIGVEGGAGDDVVERERTGGADLGQRHPLRQVRDAVEPVRAIGLPPGAPLVGLFVGDDVGHGGRRLVARFLSPTESVVAVDRTPHDRQCGIAVDDDVVGAVVPERAIVGDQQDRDDDELIGEEIHRLAVLGLHPGHRRGHRVGLGTEVEDVDGLVEVDVDVLHRDSVDLGQADERRLNEFADLLTAPREEVDVQSTRRVADVHVLSDVDRVLGRQRLGEPHAALRRGERKNLNGLVHLTRRTGTVIGDCHVL